MRVVVATLQRGRHGHLRNQARGLLRQTFTPDRWIVVSMDDDPPPLDDWPRAPLDEAAAPPGQPAAPPTLELVPLPVAAGAPLPLAAARNRAAARAEAAGAELLVMLDVDCIPSPRLVERYVAAARATAGDGILVGPVGRLAAGEIDGDEATLAAARAREPRAFPADGAIAPLERPELFWSLSYAVAPVTHAKAGGYDEGYVGYGGEDTDFAVAAVRAGIPLDAVGGAWAWHQHHPVSSPPREHLDAIVVNARRFHARWGWWPMEGWLAAFAQEGLIDWDPRAATLTRR